MRSPLHGALLLGTLLLASGVAVAGVDADGPTDGEARRSRARPARSSVSIGRPTLGRLRFGVRLAESDVLRIKPSSHGARWGTAELVGMIERAAGHVAEELPGSRLTVGDLSRRRGGRLRPHRSHRSGRDADIGFYATDPEGEPVEPRSFVPYGPDGVSRGRRHAGEYRFDVARNWELVESLVTDPEASVQYVFVSSALRRRLLSEAVRRGASAELVERAGIAMEQPRRGGRHDNHFHVRIYCPEDDRRWCHDDPPWRPWHER